MLPVANDVRVFPLGCSRGSGNYDAQNCVATLPVIGEHWHIISSFWLFSSYLACHVFRPGRSGSEIPSQ